MKLKLISISLYFMIVLSISVISYEIDPIPENTTHQHITNESQKVWLLIPYEIKTYLRNPINRDTNDNDFNVGDDIIDGSREEDRPFLQLRFFRHFWQPDNPQVGFYNDGLDILSKDREVLM